MKNDIKLILNKMENGEGFFKNNNMHVVSASIDTCVIKCDLVANSMNPYNAAHGGLIFGLGDVAMGMLVSSEGRPAVTISSSINYLKPGVGEYLVAKSTMIKKGKNICVARAEIYNDKDILVAVMDANYAFID